MLGNSAGDVDLSAISGNYGGTYNTSLSGLRDADLRLQAVANNIANSSTVGFRPDRVDSTAERRGGVRGMVVEANAAMVLGPEEASQTDAATEAINLTLARRAFTANLKAIQSQREADEATLNIPG
ncbi:flagellar basal body protein [Vampirovibrio chlorellavorus]|uniref:flagellar basal body protein n=1 Tax=Vampirovibrio chlorellavorus TaxID=758823 RepID=UPI0026EE1C58|nr:flagellar basal body protein [Vampirovibrio chlorellavorus]